MKTQDYPARLLCEIVISLKTLRRVWGARAAIAGCVVGVLLLVVMLAVLMHRRHTIAASNRARLATDNASKNEEGLTAPTESASGEDITTCNPMQPSTAPELVTYSSTSSEV